MKNFPIYCWGEQLMPRLILSESSSAVTVEVDSIPRTISPKSVWGRCEWPLAEGEQVRVQNGYYWSPGRVAGPLSVALDRGETVRIWNLNSVRPIDESVTKRVGVLDIEKASLVDKSSTVQSDLDHMSIEAAAVPMPELEAHEEAEMLKAQEYNLLNSLTVGDRVRIVLAGPPLEHLTGALGTVDGPETFGLIPVIVDDYGLKILRREQLDLVGDPDDRDPREVIQLGCEVILTRRWPGKSAELRQLVPT